jgi:hypothetical protein
MASVANGFLMRVSIFITFLIIKPTFSKEHESQQKSRMNSGAAEGKAMPAPPMTPVVLLFICYADGQNSIQKY